MGRRTSRRIAPAQDEPQLSRAARRAGGVYYTPPAIVSELVSLTLAPLLAKAGATPLRVLDPACGSGAMLAHAGRSGQALFGVDCDAAAVEAARLRTGAQVWCGDALFDKRLEKLAPFDAIVANPPFISIRQLAKSRSREYIKRLRHRFHTARGNFDVYVAFLERALELLRPGGRCGIIIPNKWATLDYARPLRELLLSQTTIEHVVDLSSQRVFAGASVYPHIIVLAKSRPAHGHLVAVVSRRIPQRVLSAEAITLSPTIDVESRAATRPLGELCTLSCGTPGYSAARVAAALHEAGTAGASPSQIADFITSGNIDRYAIQLGNVRFLGRAYERPVLPLDSPALTERQRDLFRGQKIVVAGLSQRLEAAWDDVGLALGVQVFALSEFQLDPHYLLALLNSKLLTFLFRTRFTAKCLAGGYMAINKGQLARLPIVVRSGRHAAGRFGERNAQPTSVDDAAIDHWVYRLYRLSKAEIAEVKAHCAALGQRAA
jgi:SAM-dependent methyltransferase